MNMTRGSVMSAEANVRLAQNALKDAVATSPLTGIVAKRHVQPGEKVAFDTPLVTVVDLKEIELQAMVPAVDIPELRIGMPVELAVDGFGDRKFAGRIERINPSTEPGTRAILVFVGVPNPNNELRGGMFSTGRVALAASVPVMSLPAIAVRQRAGRRSCGPSRTASSSSAWSSSARPRRGNGRVRDQDPRCLDGQGARRALRQPEGRRARLVKAPETGPRKRARRRSIPSPRLIAAAGARCAATGPRT
jgi:multidrug efflux pump subunit AcrA (membrane-fusion protein)